VSAANIILWRRPFRAAWAPPLDSHHRGDAASPGARTQSISAGAMGHENNFRGTCAMSSVTEYGRCRYQGKNPTARCESRRWLQVADSRFQGRNLGGQAQDAASLPKNFEIPAPLAARNFPERITRALSPARAKLACLPSFSRSAVIFTAVEQRLIPALQILQEAQRSPQAPGLDCCGRD